MTIARMAQPLGPVYGPVEFANGILACRAVKDPASRINWAYVDDQFRNYLPKRRAPTEQMMRIWEKENPGFPEQALRDGLVTIQDLLPWAKLYVDWSQTGIQMGQRAVNPVSRTPSAQAEQAAARSGGLETLIGGLALGWVGWKLWKAITSYRPPTDETTPQPYRPLGSIRRRPLRVQDSRYG